MKVEMRRNMKKRMVSIMLLIGIMTLVSCGKSDNINEERTDKEVIQNETIEATTQEESKADELETDADKDKYCLDEDSNVSAYFDATKEKIQEFRKPDEYSEIMAEFAADITHNGYDDRILLTVPKGATLDEVKSGVCSGQLYVLERTAEGLSDYYFMKREFSPTHVGNGQLFVTTVDDKDYLIETNFWAGQGCFTYSYDVFFEDYDTKYEMESENLVFEDCDKPRDTTEFFASLSKWINDSTYVLYVADIDYEPDLFYSTEENKISPVEYLQYK